MRVSKRSATLLVLLAGVGIAGCGTVANAPIPPSSRLLPVPGNPRGKILLSAEGAQRIGIQTAPVGVIQISIPKPPTSTTGPKKPTAGKAGAKKATAAATTKKTAPLPDLKTEVTVPYSALIYAPSGRTFVFSNPSRLTYTEIPVTVSSIKGNVVILASGPIAGTPIVTVGAEELYGVQSGVLAQT